MVGRNPPHIRKLLRKEVNYGCPVPNCGIPYLTYHHFDPPWHIKEHNEPAGMIALCRKHADKADGGAWTKDQLRKMKQNPFITQIKGCFEYFEKIQYVW